MFNITHVGNRVDISSESVDFTITPSFISGTSIPIANIEAEGCDWDVTYSGTFIASVKLITVGLDDCEFRNVTFGVPNVRGLGVELNNTKNARDTTELVGSVNLMLTNNSNALTDWVNWVQCFVRNGNYIYLQDVNGCGADKTIKVREYNLSTHTLGAAITVASFTASGFIWRFRMSYLVDRKILIFVSADYGSTPEYYGHLYLIDFETSTVSEIGTQYDIINIYTLKKSNGKVWIYLYGWSDDSYETYEIKYKNYTDGGDWGSATLSPGATSDAEKDLVFVKGKYLASIYRTTGAPPTATGFAFNLTTNAFVVGNTISSSDDRGVWDFYWFAPDNEVEKIYGIAIYNQSLGGGLYNTWEDWVEYTPSTGVIEIRYSRHADGVTAAGCYESVAFSTRKTAYIIKNPGGMVYEAYLLDYIGAVPSGARWGLVSNLLEESLLTVWWYDIVNKILYETEFDGSHLHNISCPPISGWGIDFAIEILLAGDCVIVSIKTQDGNDYQWDSFVVT